MRNNWKQQEAVTNLFWNPVSLSVSHSFLKLQNVDLLRDCIKSEYFHPIINKLNLTPIICFLQSYVDVPVTEAGIDTNDFLLATEGLIKMFGK